MVADSDAESCCTVDVTVEVLVVFTSSNVIHRNTVTKVNNDI